MGCLRRVPAGVPPVCSGGYCSVRGGRVEAYPSSIAGVATGMWPGSVSSAFSGAAASPQAPRPNARGSAFHVLACRGGLNSAGV